MSMSSQLLANRAKQRGPAKLRHRDDASVEDLAKACAFLRYRLCIECPRHAWISPFCLHARLVVCDM